MTNIKVPFFRPPVGDDEANAVADVVRSGWMTFGKKTEEFEKRFAEYIGAPCCVMLDNCTAALYLACEYQFRNVDRAKRKKITVGVPSLTCAATALAPIHAGLSVKFIDLVAEDDSFVMKTDGDAEWNIPVHYAGKYCDVTNVLVEDSAHRITRDGFTGNLQAFSFYATKNLTTGEGGMIACRSQAEADWFRKARLYGNGNAILQREKMYETGDQFWWFESEFHGWKANPTDIIASMGLVQLDKIDKLNAERKRIAERYNEAFGLKTDRDPWHLYPILIQNRDEFMHYMRENEVYCSVHFPPLHMMKAFRNDQSPSELLKTKLVYERIVSLPLYPYMTEEEQNKVIQLTLDWKRKYESQS